MVTGQSTTSLWWPVHSWPAVIPSSYEDVFDLKTRNLSDGKEEPMQAAQAISDKEVAQLCINTIRTLSMDAVQQANSGHPGAPMAMAPIAYCLWQRFLRFDPNHPIWPNRDRFVLSAGHASMLLYSMLYLTGVKAVNPKYETLGHLSVTLDDIKSFRQLDSKCPSRPGIP